MIIVSQGAILIVVQVKQRRSFHKMGSSHDPAAGVRHAVLMFKDYFTSDKAEF